MTDLFIFMAGAAVGFFAAAAFAVGAREKRQEADDVDYSGGV